MNHRPKHILLTGGAGFIGSHVAERLLQLGHRVTLVDNFDPFYDVRYKRQNLSAFAGHPQLRIIEADILDNRLYSDGLTDQYDSILHLAARAGVRPSIEQPILYQDVNVKGTQNLLEWARQKNITSFVFASSSSVYGVNPRVPWSEEDHVLCPISPYASTKVSGELMGHVYSKLYGIRFIALRFFTVFGPRQRPDLAIHLFARKLLQGQPLPFFGDGQTRRDYTYVDDIVQGVIRALEYEDSPYEIFNLGNHQTVTLAEMVSTLEDVFGIPAVRQPLPAQPGDVPLTYADISKAQRLLGYQPSTDLRTGIHHFREWLLSQPQGDTPA